MCDALAFVRFGSAAAMALTMLASRVLGAWGRYGAARDVAELAMVPAVMFGVALFFTHDGGPDGHA